jgi:metallo-beta-lactamase family protein
MRLSFHGADRTVTGSCHLVECAGLRLLIDCGLRQGSRELDEENAAPFGFEPAAVDYVLLTHAHLDHCGRLPLLVARGFRGEIIATAATRELAHIVMLDAARLQKEEARSRARRAERHGETADIEPLYIPSDALSALQRFGRAPRYAETVEVATGVRATFFDAGHILGSASVALEATEGQGRRSVVFSGDIGNRGRPLLRDPVLPLHADAVVMETTYGDRVHKAFDASAAELEEAVAETFRRGGNVIIPTFALERAQEVLYVLHGCVEHGRLPQSIQVYLDSPMAISATEIFEHHPECCADSIARLLREKRDPFHLPGLHFTRDHSESVALNDVHGGAVIMAGSGMCTGGRVRHHLRHNLGREDSSVIFVGYAARGTLARQIIDGARHVHLFGEEIPVRASVYTINGFSAHADRDELLAWHHHAAPECTVLVHGDQDVMQRFSERLGRAGVVMPSEGEHVEL